MRRLLALVVLVLASSPAAAQQAASGWRTFSYPEFALSFEAPAEPIRQKADQVLNGITVPATMLFVPLGDDAGVMAHVSDFRGNSLALNIDGVPTGAVAAVNGQLGPVTPRAWPGGEARDYTAKVETRDVRGRAIVVGRRLYQIQALSAPGQPIPAEAERFFRSVKIGP